LGTMAHVVMLANIGLFSASELNSLLKELRRIYENIGKGKYIIEEEAEDIHSQIEKDLTVSLGDLGKKIHTGRSRNDQVLVDLRLFMRHEIKRIVLQVMEVLNDMITRSEESKEILMPGYSHLQVAMPSSFGLWFGCFAESLSDDISLLLDAYRMVNRNPLGSAAGYGTSVPVDRKMTTRLLGFEDMNYNSLYVQMSRYKVEKMVLNALASVSSTLGKLASDATMFMSQNFEFLRLPDEFTTGSSIMPHKNNPDLFEVIRAKCNRILGFPNEVNLITANLTSGYFRDFQITKEIIIPVFGEVSSCLEMARLAIKNLIVNDGILEEERYKFIFCVEEVNRRVLKGVSFRDAYREVADELTTDGYKPDISVHHTHEGSIGNLCNKDILQRVEKLLAGFNFSETEKAIEELISRSPDF
ncbi:MAG: argininosuccinate lyase, partial [Bacteroidales bacterium]